MSRIASAALACALAAASASAQGAGPGGKPAAAKPAGSSHDGAFVVRLGSDTIVVERFSRSGNTYSVEQALRSPQPRLFHTHLELTPAGDLASLNYMQHRIGAPPDAPLLASTELTVGGDSATIVAKRGDSTTTRRVAVRGPSLPTLPSSYLPFELAAMRLRAARQDSMPVQLLGPGGQPTLYTAKRVGPDSVIFINPNITYRAKVDREGRILGMQAPQSTFKIDLRRVPSADVTAFATRWSQAPAMGQLSPPDSVKATVGGANVTILYSRPSKRGRVVFGDSGIAVEPYGGVWRTGANDATRLTTDKDLVIGGATVPAGTYTLWTLLDRAGWKLIVNKQTLRPDNSGRPLWGTMYDASQDLVRVNMTMSTLPTPVERMTIAVEPQGQGAVLKVMWDTTQGSVPIQAK